MNRIHRKAYFIIMSVFWGALKGKGGISLQSPLIRAERGDSHPNSLKCDKTQGAVVSFLLMHCLCSTCAQLLLSSSLRSTWVWLSEVCMDSSMTGQKKGKALE